MRRAPVFQLLVLVCCYTGIAAASEAIDSWLDKMQQAMDMKNYEGTLVIRHGDELNALRLVHGHSPDGDWDSLESLNGEARQVFRENGKVTSIFPQRKLITRSTDVLLSPLHPRLPEDREVLKKYYQLSLHGEGRVAQKAAQILVVKPRDHYRYGYRFWLDKDSGLLLKCDLTDHNGKVVEQLMFSNLKMLDHAPSRKKLAINTEGFREVDLDSGRKAAAELKGAAQRLPQGFRLTRASTKPAFHGKGEIRQMVYSDGMASVSVFVEQHMPEKEKLQGLVSMGALNAFGESLDGYHITVIGEVPRETVQLIGQSFQLDDLHD